MLKPGLTLIAALALSLTAAMATRPGIPGRELSHLTFGDVEAFMADTTRYHELKTRVLSGDRSLGIDDYAMLYYGGSFMPSYVPVDMYAAFLASAFLDGTETVDYCREIMERFPLTVTTFRVAVYYSNEHKRLRDQKVYTHYYNKLREVIWHSGDGSAEYPYQVVLLNDACEIPGVTVSGEPVDESPFSPSRMVLRGVDEEGNEFGVRYAFDLCLIEDDFFDLSSD